MLIDGKHLLCCTCKNILEIASVHIVFERGQTL